MDQFFLSVEKHKKNDDNSFYDIISDKCNKLNKIFIETLKTLKGYDTTLIEVV